MNRHIDKILKDHRKVHESRIAKQSFCVIADGEIPQNPEKRYTEIINEWYGDKK